MAGIEFARQEENSNSVIVQIAVVFMVLLSSFAVIFSVYQFDVSMMVLGTISLISSILGYSLILLMEKKKIAIVVFIPIYIVLVIRHFNGVEIFVNRFVKLWNAYYKTNYGGILVESNEISTGMMLFLFQLIVAMFLSVIIMKRRCWYVALIFIIGTVVLDSMVGYLPSVVSCLALILSAVLYFVAYHQESKKMNFIHFVIVIVIFAVLTCVGSSISPTLEKYKAGNDYKKIKEKIMAAQSFDLGLWLSGLKGHDTNYSEGGIGQGDLKNTVEFNPKGTEALKIITTEEPTKTMYLKAFVGCEYTSEQWRPGNAFALYKSSGTDDTLQELFVMSNDMYKEIVNEPYEILKRMDVFDEQTLTVEVLGASKDYGYEPYYSYVEYEKVNFDTNARGGGNKKHIYQYFDYEQVSVLVKNLDNLYQNVSTNEMTGDFFRASKESPDSWQAYKEGIDDRYLQYPDTLEELSGLCSPYLYEQGLDYVSDYIDFTFNDLQYAYHPGVKSEERDFVEDFMFHRKKGFCVHFATAATLMYRMCGVPARYVEGYVIHPSKFTERSDGTYEAVIKDYGAHAWCEVWDSNLGWQIKEHTKGYADGVNVEPTTKSEEVKTTIQETTTPAQTKVAETTTGNPKETTKKEETGSKGKLAKSLVVILGLILIGVIIFVVPQRIRRIGKIRKIKGKNSICNTYNEVCRMCIYMGCDIKKLYAREAVDKMVEMFPQLTREEWMWMYDKAVKMAFSKERINNEENSKMYILYRKLRKELLSEMKGIRKFIFLFIKGM